MSHTNNTSNYNLPQFIPTDKPAWLTDVNAAYAAIDTGMHTAQTTANSAQSDATQAITDAGDAATAAAAADAKGSGALASIESAFDPTTIYPVGAKVIYNSLLYRCIVAIVTPGPWTGSDNWERITVDSLIATSDSKIGNLSQLTTNVKSSLVGAVNDVNKHLTYDVIRNFAANDDTWTATVDGTLIVTATASTTTPSYVYLNGLSRTLGSIVCPNGAGGYSYGFSVPCIKGQTYKLLMGGFTSANTMVVYGTTN